MRSADARRRSCVPRGCRRSRCGASRRSCRRARTISGGVGTTTTTPLLRAAPPRVAPPRETPALVVPIRPAVRGHASWTRFQVADWLISSGYGDAVAAALAPFDGTDLDGLTPDELRELGVPVAVARKLVAAVAALREQEGA